MSITKVIKSRLFLPFLLYHLVFLAIVITNFPIRKFFIGWDALNPEFNLTLNFQRSIFASWQENYGLGTLGGHGFAAQLPHTMIISILSLFIPMWAVRSVFTFLCLYLGGLGVYSLARLIFFKITIEKYLRRFSIVIEYISLLTALFYILNLVAVQIFYLQLESFIVHFAALPWLFWVIFRLAREMNKKNLVLFFVINFFASIQGFIPSLFVSYAISISLLAFVYMLLNRLNWAVVKKSLLVLFLTFLVNSYWLLPFGYYQITKGGLTQNAYNNLMATEDFILKNKKYGDIGNVALMKGFSFDMQELGGYVFQPWIEHYDKIGTKIIGYSLFVFVLLSALLSLVLIRHVLVKISVVIFIYFLASLATDSSVFSLFTQFMQSLSPSYYQAFRTAFTKFALGYSFLFSLFLGLGLYILLGYSYRLLKRKVISLSVFLGLFFLIIYYALPIFKGNLFYKKLQVNIPQAYFEAIDFFKDKEDGRIADFPQDCPEGWYDYKWGYFGSGFYWYGIKQPILARTFDVWNPNNENYYWEIVRAIRSQNYREVDQLMQKYDVRWILYDQNLIHCRTKRGFLEYDEFITYLEDSPKYRLIKSLHSDVTFPIKIYENLTVRANSFIKIVGNLQNIGPKYKWNSYDKAYLDYQDYLTDKRKTFSVYYPFRSLFSSRKPDELEFELEDKGDYFSFSTIIPKELTGSQLVIPPVEKQEAEEIDESDLSKTRELLPQIFLDGELINIDLANQVNTIDLKYIKAGNLEIRVPKIKGYYSYDSDKTGDLFKQTPRSCNPINKGSLLHGQVNENGINLLRLVSNDSNNCLDIDISNLSQKFAYLATIVNRNIEGKSLSFTLINKTTQKPELETYLPKGNNGLETSYLIIPPMRQYGLGYTLHFDNKSIGRVKTVNDLGRITVNPIPYRFLTSLKIVKGDLDLSTSEDSWLPLRSSLPPSEVSLVVSHPNPSFYQVSINRQQITDNKQQKTTLVGDSLIGGSEMIRFSGPSNSFNISNRNNFVNSSFSKSGPQGNRTPGTWFEGPAPNHSRPTQKPSDQETNKIVNQVLAADSSDYSTLEESYSVALSTIGGVMASPAQPATPEVYLTLSQSFDKGWKAYQVSCQLSAISCQLKNLLPFLFFEEIKDHVMVNNWENGWEIGNQLSDVSDQNSVVSNQSEKNKPTTGNRPRKASPRGKQPTITIAIVYLPQYLEYLGFGLLGVSILYLLLTKQTRTA